MTPECPKGPERGARPDLSQTVFEALWKTFEDEGGRLAPGTADRLTEAVLKPISSELERLTAEVEHHKRQHELWARLHTGEHEFVKSLLGQGEIGMWLVAESRWLLRGMARRVGELRASLRFADAHVPQWERIIEEHKAEVSRLREQLAAQPRVPADADELVSVALNAATNRCNAALSESLDIALTDAVMDLLKLWGVSSSEVGAPQPQEMEQHRVVVTKAAHGMASAYCFTCKKFCAGLEQKAEDWKDQHEADTLRPQVGGVVNAGTLHGKENGAKTFVSQEAGPPGLVIPQRDEGRPAGSTVAAPHSEPTFSVDDMVSAGWETAVAQGERDLLLKMAGELLKQCTDWDDQYGVCAESVPDPACRIRAIVNRYAIQPDAAQAARSEATPRVWAEVDLQPCPEDVRQVRDCNNFVWRRLVNDQWITGHQGDGPCGWPYLIKKFGPLTEVPSPSLRKEGEDSE